MRSLVTLFLFAFFYTCCNATITDTLRIDVHALDPITGGTYLWNDSFNTPAINITIYNDGSNVVSDNIGLGYQVDGGSSYISDSSIYHPVRCNNPVFSIQPHDSAVLTNVTFFFGSPAFFPGSSVVVIWPLALHNNTFIKDSVGSTIRVVSTLAGIATPDNDQMKVYMSGQQLYLENEDKNVLREVRIYSLIGGLMTEQQITEQGRIPMGQYSPGVYFVDVILANNKHQVFKVFNPPGR